MTYRVEEGWPGSFERYAVVDGNNRMVGGTNDPTEARTLTIRLADFASRYGGDPYALMNPSR